MLNKGFGYASVKNVISQHLLNCKANKKVGNEDKEESLSFLISVLRGKGWTGFGNLSESKDLMKELGFAVRVRYIGARGTRRIYVGVNENV